jgi:3-oxoacyl-[acyl-carrier-protein] synthase-3
VILNDIYLAGVGTADTGVLQLADAVAQGSLSADDANLGGLASITLAGTAPAPDLAVEAARCALADSGHPPCEISAVFHTNVHPQGPDGWSAQHYINHKTVDQPVTSIEVHNGCVGFFSALALASCHLLAAPEHTAALVTAADNFGTPAVDRWHASRLFALSDGGGAVVVSKRGGFARVLACGAASRPELEAHHRGGERLFPPGITSGAMLNFEERMQFGQRMAQQGLIPSMGDFGTLLVETVEQTLKEAGLTLDDVSRVIHDGFNREALHAIFLDPLGVGEDRGIWEYTRTTGHAGPLDQIRGLEYAWRNHKACEGDRVLLVSGSPGMEAACAVLEITNEPA